MKPAVGDRDGAKVSDGEEGGWGEGRTHEGPDTHDPGDDRAGVDAHGEVVDGRGVGHVEVSEAELALADDEVVAKHAAL